jgi:SRSO17 transposase
VTTHDDLAVAAGHSVDPGRWLGIFDELMLCVGVRFRRVEPRRRARAFVLGLLAGLPRANCWSIAEHAGDASPAGMQHLLSRACWDAGGVRDDIRGYVAQHLGDPGGMLVVDETGDLKKGAASAGVQRQYTGTAGRVENCQVAVFLTYAAPGGHALIDRELYLPESWTSDPARCAAAGIPGDVAFATKPGLALRMITRALDAGTPAGWVSGDEVYGADPQLRAGIEERQVSYVLAVAKSHPVATAAGVLRADALVRKLPPRAWQRLSAGAGAKGHRWYDWAWVAIDPGVPGYRWLLIRRHRRTRELAYYRCYSPRHVPLTVLVTAAGRRWMVEEDFQASKGLAALDEHQVRRWTSWYRWVTLAMLALAFLTIAALAEHAQPPPPGMIPLTRNEIAHLTVVLITQPARDARQLLRWSAWRRHHQHTARTCHYQHQAAHDP